MQETILHIGRHKSGTSSLQHFFVSNSQVLNGLGYLYPEAMRLGIAHHRLAEFFKPPPQGGNYCEESMALLSEEYRRFCQETEGAEKILISSEALQNIKQPSLITPYLQGAVKVIVYIREQTEYLVSSYAQAVQNQKMTLSLKEYEEQRFHANYANFLASWESAFGRDALTVRLYDRNEFVGGDVRLDFLSLLGLAKATDQFSFAQDDRNPSIGGALLEFKRRLNAVEFESVINRVDLYKLLGKIAISQPAFNQGAWDAGLADKVRQKYQASNQSVLAKYFPDRDKLFDIKGKLSASDSVSVSFAEIAQAIDGLQPALGGKLLKLIQ